MYRGGAPTSVSDYPHRYLLCDEAGWIGKDNSNAGMVLKATPARGAGGGDPRRALV
jgi:hypothetical protein